MRARRGIGMAALALVLLTACEKGTPGTGAGGSPTPATSVSPTASVSPSPSLPSVPSATQILYAGTPNCPGGSCVASPAAPDLWLYDVTTSTNRRLTNDGSAREETRPRFAGTDVSFIANTSSPFTSVLYRMPLAGGPARAVIKQTNTSLGGYGWSPDGRTLAYIDSLDVPRLMLMTPGGAKRVLKKLPSGGGRGGTEDDEVAVTWSPDGKMILAVATFLDGATMFVVRPDATEVVAARAGTFARWSPDSKTIYYRSWNLNGSDSGRWSALDVATGTTRALDATPRTLGAYLSPDGTRLAYYTREPQPVVYLYDIASGSERKLGEGVAPRWLSATSLIATEVRSCVGQEECGGHGPEWRATGKTVEYPIDGASKPFGIVWTMNVDIRYAV